MKCALASVGFVNEDMAFNKDVILGVLKQYARQVDMALFGEAFLQGFCAATFDAAHDAGVAVTLDDPAIAQIRFAAKESAVAVSFGFLEKAADGFYSSQLTIDSQGAVLDLFRRVSPGWKIPSAGPQYREGPGFHTFNFLGKRIAIGLCGDLWHDGNVRAVSRLEPDLVFWPVYTDFPYEKWNAAIKYEYAAQAAKICRDVLYVNPFCLDKDAPEIAKGGCALFRDGKIQRENPAGRESVLVVTV